MARKKGSAGQPDWLVTFADLMSILVCFFVLIISFSIQDKQKLQIVAGSMRDAFGIRFVNRRAGMIEREGTPARDFVKQVSIVPRETDTDFADERHDKRRKQGPEANTHDIAPTDIERPRQFATAIASLRQAWQELPDIAELNDQIMVEDTPDGLNIQLIDQEGRSMFRQGSAEPTPRTRALLEKMAPTLARLPNPIAVTGHTDASRAYEKPGTIQWDLSAERALAAQRILHNAGLPHDRFYSVTGRADAEPLFPEDPFLPANRRISILVMKKAPPVPPGLKP